MELTANTSGVRYSKLTLSGLVRRQWSVELSGAGRLDWSQDACPLAERRAKVSAYPSSKTTCPSRPAESKNTWASSSDASEEWTNSWNKYIPTININFSLPIYNLSNIYSI
jgi:hypothetical protein